MNIKNVFYLPSGRIFLFDIDGYLIESTEMRDVSISGKEHFAVRSTNDPHVIWKHLKPYSEKWLLTVSTQKGCVHNCNFCDVAGLPFKGNLSQDEIEEQIRNIITYTPYVHTSSKVKIGFARMGEPAHNLSNVVGAIKNLSTISKQMNKYFTWLPCFNSILPKKTMQGIHGLDVVDNIINLKNNSLNGMLHFQISCNSTDETQRKKLFGGADVLSLQDIVKHINKQHNYGRTITLNFIVMQGIEVNVHKLIDLGLDGNIFTVKLIPLNDTARSKSKNLKTFANYDNYEKLVTIGKEFNKYGIKTVVDAIAKCEEAGLCCGQLAQIYQ